MKNYLYQLLARYFGFYLLPHSKVVIYKPTNNLLKNALEKEFSVHISDENMLASADTIILNGTLHYERDIQAMLETIHRQCTPQTRILLNYYSSLWKPLFLLADKIGVRKKQPDENWIAPSDVENLLTLSNFELVGNSQHILIPVKIPLVSNWVNRWLAPLPFFRLFALVNIGIARPIFTESTNPSVSVVVAARNESGNIEALFKRLPLMGSSTELVIIEGNSTDDTWAQIQKMKAKYSSAPFSVVIGQQDGKGKGDAVRKGFSMASKDILMILDADLTVAPEDLPKFYQAMVQNKGEFINGSRLVYPMESQAMRFFNIIGNKFFAMAFTFVLGQSFKDTLCGTKVLSRRNYEILARERNYFGDFDPFGDFDLIFGASRLALKIMELPIRYRDRTYGETNISRWTHGMILLRMVIFAARRIKFI